MSRVKGSWWLLAPLLAGCSAGGATGGVGANDGSAQDAATQDAASQGEVAAAVDVAAVPSDSGGDELSQRPPVTGARDIEAWLSAGHYRSWRCEPMRHAARPGSAHSANRICSNAALSGSEGTGEYPVGAASVKELFDSAGSLTGYAVSVRVAAGSAPSAWYWYERLAPGRVVADSTGERGGARAICASCHIGASRDNVFTRVQ